MMEASPVFSKEGLCEFLAGRAESMYQGQRERAALRCALGDAAAVCDDIASNILNSSPRKSKQRDELAKLATHCGDTISKLRDLIEVPQ